MLCVGVLVLGAGDKSGSLITAKYAEEYKKPIFALPYPPMSGAGVGCNALIKRGAKLTEEAKDVLDFFGLETEKKQAVDLTDTEQKAWQFLVDNGVPYSVWNYLSTPNDGNRFSLVDDDTRKILSEDFRQILLGEKRV